MTHLTNENFRRETEFAEQPVLIDFYQDNCVPCRNMEPVFDKLEAIYGERYKFCKADVAAQEGVRGHDVGGFVCGFGKIKPQLWYAGALQQPVPHRVVPGFCGFSHSGSPLPGR